MKTLRRLACYRGLDTLVLYRRCSAVALFLAVLSASLVTGCGSSGVGQSGVDGYWKGQLIEETRENQRPRRILLRLEEGSGSVEGWFAQSSDAVAFRRMDEEGSRSVATQPVTGTFDGARLLVRFPSEAGLAYEVDAVVDNGLIEGTYVARNPSGDGQQTLSGRFEVGRY